MSEQAINYEQLVESYENRLLNQLRSHGVDLDFLEMWVPDENPVSSILNMVEAAGAFGVESFTVRVNRDTLPAGRTDDLKTALAPLSDISVEDQGDHCLVHISSITA
ncbi:hypothetical protein [Nisaea nitritireducens]|uniref:hypothetical protein n=1 Tax=Nisaea nitritireducens TaxID=568392 RepID=UPI001866D1F7|nr:hypothetical protein [Nisaea nitritireducens]